MTSEQEQERAREQIKGLLYRVRPGDILTLTTNKGGKVWTDKKMFVDRIKREQLRENTEPYYRIYARGPSQRKDPDSGSYVLMPEKPDGKGNHPVPEIYHITPNQSAKYTETTRGTVVSLTVTVE